MAAGTKDLRSSHRRKNNKLSLGWEAGWVARYVLAAHRETCSGSGEPASREASKRG